MDDADRKLLLLIGQNPRIHFRELAKRLGISRQAAHRRIQALTESGVIKPAMAGVSISYLDAVPLAISGKSMTESVEKTLDRLGESEFTRRVVVAGGNYLYVVGILRDISELDRYLEFVKRTAEMPEPEVGIYCLDNDGLMPYSVDGSGRRQLGNFELTPLDYKIVGALRDDARRPIAEIADFIGVSSKTVRRHLDKMISEGALDMNVPMDMSLGGDLFLVMHVNLKYGADKREVGRRLLARRYFQDQYIRTYSNNPSLLGWIFWSASMADVRRALSETGADADVQSVMLNFAYMERLYPTWRDRLPEMQAPPRRKKGRTLVARRQR